MFPSLLKPLLRVGEPVSVSLDSEDSTVGLSKLSPGSTYEVSVISILGLDESDPLKDLVMTREFGSSNGQVSLYALIYCRAAQLVLDSLRMTRTNIPCFFHCVAFWTQCL